MGKDNLSGKKRYYNGEKYKYFIPGEQPDGWILGTPDRVKQQASKTQLSLWKDSDYRARQILTRSSDDYSEKMSKISKQFWMNNYDVQCQRLSDSAKQRFQNKSQVEACRMRMITLWSDEQYRENQMQSLRESHKNLYDEHPEYKNQLSISNKRSWELNKSRILEKQRQTKHKNDSWTASKLEDAYYNYLLTLYSKEDIVRQYYEARYPFYCDFYIKSEDKFIEIQGTWTHGGHFFDCTNEQDILKLNTWKEKAITSKYYQKAIKVWTETDLLKRRISQENNLNIEFIY